MSQQFLTLTKTSEALYKERGSKFFCFAMPISSIDDAKSAIASLSKKHHKARHVCFAYRIGENGETYRSYDDGEPSGTAGKPILRQIEHHNLSNVLVVVVRYFGGTKLGTGSLMRAYREASSEALNSGIKGQYK